MDTKNKQFLVVGARNRAATYTQFSILFLFILIFNLSSSCIKIVLGSAINYNINQANMWYVVCMCVFWKDFAAKPPGYTIVGYYYDLLLFFYFTTSALVSRTGD